MNHGRRIKITGKYAIYRLYHSHYHGINYSWPNRYFSSPIHRPDCGIFLGHCWGVGIDCRNHNNRIYHNNGNSWHILFIHSQGKMKYQQCNIHPMNRKARTTVSSLLLSGSSLALVFLIYTLVDLNNSNDSMMNSRVIFGIVLFIALLSMGLYFRMEKPID